MLIELTVRNLGVIDDLTLTLGRGMTALTGETGAGKTLVVEAIELLVGGRADGTLVRPGAEEAWIEGRFVEGESETVLARAVPAEGRSRGYIDGRMASATALAEAGARLVDLHGQHAHQSLLAAAAQRRALDVWARIDHGPLVEGRARVKDIRSELAGLGGDGRARAREVDLLQFQVQELEGVTDPDEDTRLEAEETVLGQASHWRSVAESAHAHLTEAEAIGAAASALRGSPFEELAARLADVQAECDDIARELRQAGEAIADDPERLASIQARRQVLRDLRRKYGDTLAEVMTFAADARTRLAELRGYEARAATLESELRAAEGAVAEAAKEIAAAREAAAPGLAAEVERHLQELAMPKARFTVAVGGEPPADEVVFGLGANPGEPVLPLAKVASGGELARTMLAARLVLTAGPPALVFDEVDAGVGGEAATAVGRSLACLAEEPGRQVLVVTHLAQVAAFADAHVAVVKAERDGRTVATATRVDGEERVRELSRMLSGRPDSESARAHAAELLAGRG